MYTRHTVEPDADGLGVDEKTATEELPDRACDQRKTAAVQAHLEQVTKMREDAHG